MNSIIDKDSLIIGGIVLLSAFWIYMQPQAAAPMINTVLGGLLGYLGGVSRGTAIK